MVTSDGTFTGDGSTSHFLYEGHSVTGADTSHNGGTTVSLRQSTSTKSNYYRTTGYAARPTAQGGTNGVFTTKTAAEYNALSTSDKVDYELIVNINDNHSTEAATWGQVAQDIVFTGSDIGSPNTNEYRQGAATRRIFKGPVGARVEVTTHKFNGMGTHPTFIGTVRKDKMYQRWTSQEQTNEGYTFLSQQQIASNTGHSIGTEAHWIAYTAQVKYIAGNFLLEVDKATEGTTSGTSFTYYQNVVNGMNAYTIHSPKTMLRVIDAQTSKFKMVNFDLTNPTGLMIPFSYEVIKSLPNDHVTSLVTASAHISLYVADVQIIEQPTWVKLLKIVQVVLFIMALISGQLAIAEALKAMIKQIIINLVIEKIVVTIAKEISPELALVVAVAIGYQLSGGKAISFTSFKDLGNLIANTTDLIASVVETTVEGLQDDLTAEWDAEKERQKTIEDQLAELNEEYSPNTLRNLNNLINVNMQSSINPMMPTEYLAFYDNFNVLGFEDFNYDNNWDVLYETQVMQT